MTGFAHDPSSGQTTLSEIAKVRSAISANAIFGCYAYATQSGFRVFELAMGKNFWRDTNSRWLVGIDYGRSDPRALKEIANRTNTKVRVFDGRFVVDSAGFVPRRDYHPKLAMMENTSSGSQGLVLGSGNFSYNGLQRSVEAGASFTATTISEKNEHIEAVSSVFENLWKKACPLDDIIVKYEARLADLIGLKDESRPQHSNGLAKGFWIEAGYVTKNRGQGKPGNQIFAPNGFRHFFGLKKVKSGSTHIGCNCIKVPSTKSLRDRSLMCRLLRHTRICCADFGLGCVLLVEVILPRLTEDNPMNIQHSTPATPLRARMIADMSGRNLGPASQSSHLRACTRFAVWLGRSPETATPDDVKYFQQHLIESGASIGTRNQTMTGVKFLFRVTLRRHDLVAEIFHLKEPVKIPLVLSKKEIKRILAMAPSLKARVMLSLAYGCGLRASEVVRLKVGDIDSDQGIIRIVQSKGRKDRNVMLPVDILNLLREWWAERPTGQDKNVPAPERVLFPGYSGNHLSSRQISRLFKETAREAGITKPVTLHTLRHSFATHLLERGVDIRVIQALLGHAKLTTTARYASVATGMIAKVDSPLDDLNGATRKKRKVRPT